MVELHLPVMPLGSSLSLVCVCVQSTFIFMCNLHLCVCCSTNFQPLFIGKLPCSHRMEPFLQALRLNLLGHVSVNSTSLSHLRHFGRHELRRFQKPFRRLSPSQGFGTYLVDKVTLGIPQSHVQVLPTENSAGFKELVEDVI